MNRANIHLIASITILLYIVFLVVTCIAADIVLFAVSGKYDDIRWVVPASLFSFVIGGLPFLLLHFPVLLGLWAIIPIHRARLLPLLSGVAAAIIGFVLRHLTIDQHIYDGYNFFIASSIASIITAIVSGCFLARKSALTRQEDRIIATAIALGICIPCFLYGYFVRPGRYMYDDHRNYRVDWLIGSTEDCTSKADGCE